MMQPGKLSILPLESKQWGRIPARKGVDFTFPIAFKNECVYANADHYGAIAGITFNVDCTYSLTGGHIYTNNDGSDPVWIYFYVVGY